MMTAAQEGAYIRLICYDWANDGIPSDIDKLAALARTDRGGIGGVIDCFIPHPSKPGFLTNERLLKEREKQECWREKSAIGGKKGAARRWKKEGYGVNGGGHSLVNKCLSPNDDQSMALHLHLQSSSSECTDVRTRFKKPEIGEMKLHAEKIGLPETEVDACWNYYESNGWKVGRNPMRSWQSAMVNWRKNWEERRNGNRSARPETKMKVLQERIDSHPANRESVHHRVNATVEQKDELKKMIGDLTALKRSVI